MGKKVGRAKKTNLGYFEKKNRQFVRRGNMIARNRNTFTKTYTR